MTTVVSTVWRATLVGYDGDDIELHRSKDSAEYAVARHKKAAGSWGEHSHVDEIEVLCAFCSGTCHCENDE